MSALAIVNAQVEAFNSHDVDAFIATYAPDAVIVGAAPHVLEGHAAMRTHYTQRLVNSALRCDIDTVVVFGDRWVVAREAIQDGDNVTEVVATFDVVGDVIVRVSMLRA